MTPYDDDIAAIEARKSDVHTRYALTVLKSKQEGYRQALKDVLPRVRENDLTDEEIAWLKETKGERTPGPTG